MKIGVIILFVIFFMGVASAVPYILFVNPTPTDNYETTASSFEINSSITNLAGLEEFIFNWDGTNYTFYNDSLVLMMNFENNSMLGENDSFVRDLSKYENNGTVSAAIFNSAGKYGGAYNFSGKEKITIANSASLNITDSLTISLWAKANNVLVKQVSAGALHTCVLTEKGDAYCWGYNGAGELGIGNTINSLSPKLVLGGHNFSSISIGSSFASAEISEHTCGIDTLGNAYCWGYNGYGQLGIGNTTQMNAPQLALGGYNFSSISAGAYHTCAINTIGNAYCWGYSGYGQLGIGNTTNMPTPQLVLGGYNFSKISAGAYHTCAINTTRSVFCWGYNGYGQLGIGNTTNMPTPQLVLGGYNFTLISSGSSHTCALNTTGSTYCWGYNGYGQLGIGNTTNMPTPQLVLGGYNFSKISAGAYHTCALNTTGSAFCWGYNIYRQLGADVFNVSDVVKMNTPQLVLGGNNFSSISAGILYTCGKTNDNNFYCWGYNVYGQLGTGFTEAISPKPISKEYNFTSISAGMRSTCGINKTGSAFCWGINLFGQLGIGNTTNMPTPTPQLVLGGHNFTSISGGVYHTCGIDTLGNAYCWGYNGAGELGIGNKTTMPTPQLVLGGNNFSSISSAYGYTCALNKTGSAFCWGYNGNGELGIGNTTNMPTPTPQLVFGGHNFTSISGGFYHTCGIDTLRNAYCWGYNGAGALGIGNSSTTVNMTTP